MCIRLSCILVDHFHGRGFEDKERGARDSDDPADNRGGRDAVLPCYIFRSRRFRDDIEYRTGE